MKHFLLLAALLLSLVTYAQDEHKNMVAYNAQFRFNAGLYRSEEDFFNNLPIPLETIESNHDKSERDFYPQLFNNKIIYYSFNGMRMEIKTNQLWGYTDGRTVYVAKGIFPLKGEFSIDMGDLSLDQSKKGWNRLDIIGSICVLSVVEEHKNNYPNMAYTIYTQTTKQTERYVLDMALKTFKKLSFENVSRIVQRDALLYSQCQERRLKKEEKIYYYIREYNNAHPIFFPQ